MVQGSRQQRALGWTAYIGGWILLGGLKSVAAIEDFARRGGHEAWRPIVWEMTSVLIIGTLLPLVYVHARRVLAAQASWVRRVPGYLCGLLAFWLCHVTLMIGSRKLLYLLMGAAYTFDGFRAGWLYELSKDSFTYSALAAMSTALLLWRRQTAARHAQRIVIRDGSRTVNLDPTTISSVKAEGNYVRIHCATESYFVRKTLKSFEGVPGLVRVHRSSLVNVSMVHEVVAPQDDEAVARLHGGHEVAVSRRFRAALLNALRE
jgi:DNA-binding LytR/AlgR family response regulator